MKKSWFYQRNKFNIRNDEFDCLRTYFNDFSFLPYIGNIIKTDKLREIDIDVSLISYFDVSLWVKLLLKGCKIGFIDKYVAGWRIHEKQMSSVSQAEKLYTLSEFEKTKMAELFLQIDNVDLLKKIFKDNYFLNTIENITNDDIKFIVSYEMLKHDRKPIQITGYNHIYDLIQKEESRKYLEEKFNFGIKEFRKIYTSVSRGSIAIPDMKLLSIFIIKKLIRIISLTDLQNMFRKQTNL